MSSKPSLNLFVLLRLVIGIFFVLVSLHKLLSPYQNFLYVIQNYEFLPSGLEKLSAHLVPWVEFLLGMFLVLGFQLNIVLPAFLALVGSFILIVSQALIRKLPIDSCGCFGDSFPMKLNQILVFDSVLFLVLTLLLANLKKTSVLGLDLLFSNRRE